MPNTEVLKGNAKVIKPIQIPKGSKCKGNAEGKNKFSEQGFIVKKIASNKSLIELSLNR
jgi:hypothetical protein